MWRKDKYYVLHGMTLNWWFTPEVCGLQMRISKGRKLFYSKRINCSTINRGLHPALQSFSSGVLTKGLKLLAAHYTIQPFCVMK